MNEVKCDLIISSRTGHDDWVAFSHYFKRGDTYTLVNFYGYEDAVPLTFEMWEYTREEFEHCVWSRLYYLLEDLESSEVPGKAKLVITISDKGRSGGIYQYNNHPDWPGLFSFIEVISADVELGTGIENRGILAGLPDLEAFLTDLVTKEHLEIDLVELKKKVAALEEADKGV